MAIIAEDLPGFERFVFFDGGIEKSVYRAGSGPAVVLIHELPGMVPECVELGRRIAAEGYAVYMPLLFGEPNRIMGRCRCSGPASGRSSAC